VHAYIFDLDNTLISGNCSFKYYSFLHKKKVFSYKDLLNALKYLVKYLYFDLSPTELHQKVFSSFLKGRLFNEIFSYVDEFLDEYLNELINPTVLSFVNRAKKQNDRIILLSNSPQYLAEPIARRLHISECYGSSYNVDENNRFASISNIMDGKAKAKYTTNLGGDIDKRIVFTDSIWDRPLLEVADMCYVVNPDNKLSTLAKAKGWYFL
jgi:HAD superfamily hydrolase (TIGR01490 family)